MAARLKFAFLFSGAIAVSAGGASPAGLGSDPGAAPSDSPAWSAAARLGIRFIPKAKDSESTSAAPQLPPGTIVLPPFVVADSRVRLSESDILTEKGKIEFAENRYLSPLYRVAFGPLAQVAGYYFNFLSILGGWHPNEAEAMTLYRQDERLKMLREMDSLIGLEMIDHGTDPKPFHRVRFDATILSR